MAQVLVTGATGCVGVHITESPLNHGYAVRALRRSSSHLAALVGPEFERVSGDIVDTSSLESAMAGCELAFYSSHCREGVLRILRRSLALVVPRTGADAAIRDTWDWPCREGLLQVVEDCVSEV